MFCSVGCLIIVSLAIICHQTLSVESVDPKNKVVPFPEKTFLIETRVVVDKSAWDQWVARSNYNDENRLKKEIKSLFLEVSDIYKNTESQADMIFKFSILDIEVLDHDVLDKAAINGDGTRAIRQMTTFRNKYPLHNKKADIVILLTGHNLNTDIVGWGQIQSICNNNAIAIAEFHGIWQDASILAHEIGHVLGLRHDGYHRDDYQFCRSSDGYIMSASPSRKANKFIFSSCSINKLLKFFVYKDDWQFIINRCLKDGNLADALDEKTVPRFNKLVSPDEHCQRKYGRDSYVHRQAFWGNTNFNKVCLFVECTGSVKRRFVAAPPGIGCGTNKHCESGKCVAIKDPKELKEASKRDPYTCPFGDRSVINHKNYTKCSQLPASECRTMKYDCCQTCNLAKLNRPDVECRKRLGATSALARFYYEHDYNYEALVCKSLECVTEIDHTQFKYKRFVVGEHELDGMICGHNKVCSRRKCIKAKTGEGISFNTDRCPFGNQPFIGRNSENTCEMMNKTKPERCGWPTTKNVRYKSVCCETCL